MPFELRNLPLTVINAPPILGRDRPTTESTIALWLQNSPEPGEVLFFSNQPFVLYQDAVITSLMPEDFLIETVGTKGGEELPISTLLDTVAKYVQWKNTP